MIILARILSPKDFGLIGMLTVFITLSQILINGGFNEALIQKKTTDNEDYSSIFYINLVISLLLYLILFFAAPLIAEFYHQPQLILLTRVLSLVFVFNSVAFVPRARITKELKFKILTIIQVPATVISAIIAIAMALLGFGVWSIVALQVVMRLVYAIHIWIYSKWVPLFSFNFKKVKSLFAFGGRLMFSDVLDGIYSNIYLIIIGKFFHVNILGYYQNARSLVFTPVNTFADVVKGVTFPAFSSIQEDNTRLKKGYKMSIQQLLFWTCFPMVLAGVLAVPLFRFILTDKWLPAVPFFRLICVSGIIMPLNTFNLNIVNVKGRSDLYLKLNIIKKILITIGIIATLPFGIWPLVTFQAFFSIVQYFINSYYSGKFIDYSINEQLKDVVPILCLSIVIGLVVFLLDWMIMGFPDVLRLLIGFGFGGTLYLLLAKKLNFEAYMDSRNILKFKNKA